MGRTMMALTSAAVILLTAVFIAHKLASARQFTAQCTKKPDGQFLCATNTPDAEVDEPEGMTGYFGCAMRCTLDERCQHFNHRSPASMPCQLFYSPPTGFNVTSGCDNYRAKPAGAMKNCYLTNNRPNKKYVLWYLPHSRVHKSMAELCSNFGD